MRGFDKSSSAKLIETLITITTSYIATVSQSVLPRERFTMIKSLSGTINKIANNNAITLIYFQLYPHVANVQNTIIIIMKNPIMPHFH